MPSSLLADRYPLICRDCKKPLLIDLVAVTSEHRQFPVSLALGTSVVGTTAWMAKNSFRCGTCFIKFQTTKPGPRMQNIAELEESEGGE